MSIADDAMAAACAEMKLRNSDFNPVETITGLRFVQTRTRLSCLKFLYDKLVMRGRNKICNTTGMKKYLFAFQSYFHDFVVAQTLALP